MRKVVLDAIVVLAVAVILAAGYVLFGEQFGDEAEIGFLAMGGVILAAHFMGFWGR